MRIANLLAYRCVLQFRLDRRIDGFFGKRPMLGRFVGKLFAELHQRSSGSSTRDGWPEEETTFYRLANAVLPSVKIRLTSPPLIAKIRPDRRSERLHSTASLRHRAF